MPAPWKGAGKALSRLGDERIDGIIKEDRLGLDVIYLQAKRWERTIGRPDIQQFAGALQGQRARKGVFITTSSFSAEARDYANRIDTRILIDGTELTKLMIAHGVGVTPVAVYELKRWIRISLQSRCGSYALICVATALQRTTPSARLTC